MMQKIKGFMSDKKELFLFLGVLIIVFGTVLTIADIALKDKPHIPDIPIIEEPVDPDDEIPVDETPVEVEERLINPVSGDFVIVRHYFDINDVATLNEAVISNGKQMYESKGMSFAKADNSVFDVLAVLSGKVIMVEEDALDGIVIAIDHGSNLVSYYYSLGQANVSVNDEVTIGQVIGQAGNSLFDLEAGVHVHLELRVGDDYVNPKYAYDKRINDFELDIDK